MKFEWDPSKNERNIRKHHLDFADSWKVFQGPMLTQLEDRFEYEEMRTVSIGFLEELIVVLVFVEIADDIIRPISFRKANKNERERFYKYLANRLG